MLEVGNGMSVAQDMAHFTMWCMLASPLIAGNDLDNMNATTLEILTNKNAIAVNQDPLGKQAKPCGEDGDVQFWAKPLATPAGAVAVALLNRGQGTSTVTLQFSSFGAATSFAGFDIWNDMKPLGTLHGSVSATLGPTSVAFYKLVPPTGN